ncbi:hypothetical protein BN2537_5571 [Streptomyces venezuelae]|nr:hypothetical protein BN2537_5571 [Streptomyces venezuelae]
MGRARAAVRRRAVRHAAATGRPFLMPLGRSSWRVRPAALARTCGTGRTVTTVGRRGLRRAALSLSCPNATRPPVTIWYAPNG